jgi:hypothetical protein
MPTLLVGWPPRIFTFRNRNQSSQKARTTGTIARKNADASCLLEKRASSFSEIDLDQGRVLPKRQ